MHPATRPRLFSLSLTALIPLLGASWPTALFAQMSVDQLVITSGPSHFDGIFTDFFIDPVVFGSEIAAVSVTAGSGETVDFVEIDEDEFACDGVIPEAPCEGFESLAEINALGDLTFNLVGESGEMDSIFVPADDYIPGAGQPGLPAILSPPQGSTSFPPSGILEWSTPLLWVEAIQVDLVDVQTDDGVDEALFFDTTTTSWSPGNVVPGRDYEFEVSFVDAYFIEDSRTTVGARPYLFTSGFQSFNSKFVPEPRGASIWIAAITWLGLIGRVLGKKRPIAHAGAIP